MLAVTAMERRSFFMLSPAFASVRDGFAAKIIGDKLTHPAKEGCHWQATAWMNPAVLPSDDDSGAAKSID
jgi:hypothetical protein